MSSTPSGSKGVERLQRRLKMYDVYAEPAPKDLEELLEMRREKIERERGMVGDIEQLIAEYSPADKLTPGT